MNFEDKQHVCSDCWVTARDAERERIIKLLEEMAKSTFAGDVWHINPFDYAIALVKEENK